VEENVPARNLGPITRTSPHGHHYEHDEAHEVLVRPMGGTSAPHRFNPPPKVSLGRAGTMDSTRPTISAAHEQPIPDVVYMSELGPTGPVANGGATAVDERDPRCTGRSARPPPRACRARHRP
jgi:hypothetical protein